MADLTPEQREELCRRYPNLTCPSNGKHVRAGTHRMRPAPNDAMPNEQEYDFRCDAGYLFNAFDVLVGLLSESQ